MHDTRANKMEEGHHTIQAKKRAIHDDTHIWGKTDPTYGGNPPLIPNGEEETAPEAVLVVRFEGEKVLVDLTRGREVRCYQQPKDEQLHLWWQRLHFFALRSACLEKNSRTGPVIVQS